MTFREEFQDFIKKSALSQNKAGEGMGYTGSVVSQWLGGSYKGNVEEVEAAARAWVGREQARRAKKQVPITRTETITRVINAITIAHEEKDIALMVGEAGVGKSTALRLYASENAHGTILIEVDDSMNKVALVQELAGALGVDRKTPYVELVRQIGNLLAERDYVVICDEADYLSDGCLELLRRIVNDKGCSGLVLAGLPRLEHRIKNLKNDHQQLASRVGVFLYVDGLKETDSEKIIRSVWPELGKDTVKAFQKAAGYSIRHLSKLIDRAHRTDLANGRDMPDAETVSVAGALLLK